MTNQERRDKLSLITQQFSFEILDQDTTSERIKIRLTPNQYAIVWMNSRYHQKSDAFAFDIFGDEQPYKYVRETINIGDKKTPEKIASDFQRRVIGSKTMAENEILITKEKAYKEKQANGLAENRAIFENAGFIFSDRQRQETYKAINNSWVQRNDEGSISIRYEIEAGTACEYNSIRISGLDASEWQEILATFNNILTRHN